MSPDDTMTPQSPVQTGRTEPEMGVLPRPVRMRFWDPFWSAVQFLTRLPTPPVAFTNGSLAGALPWFPVVGALLGCAGGALDWLLAPHLGALAAAVITVAGLVMLTGALHEDGLADAADAFGSSHSRTRTLAILRDSRIGSYGALALGLALLLRVALLVQAGPGRAIPVLVAALALGRWSTLPLARLPAARTDLQENGLGSRVAGRTGWAWLTVPTVVTVAIAASALHWLAVPAALAAAAVTAGAGWFFQQRLGGVTGDCFGATVQLVELAVMLCAVWR